MTQHSVVGQARQARRARRSYRMLRGFVFASAAAAAAACSDSADEPDASGHTAGHDAQIADPSEAGAGSSATSGGRAAPAAGRSGASGGAGRAPVSTGKAGAGGRAGSGGRADYDRDPNAGRGGAGASGVNGAAGKKAESGAGGAGGKQQGAAGRGAEPHAGAGAAGSAGSSEAGSGGRASGGAGQAGGAGKPHGGAGAAGSSQPSGGAGSASPPEGGAGSAAAGAGGAGSAAPSEGGAGSAAAGTGGAPVDAGIAEPEFEQRVVALDLASPWELSYGPDDYLWVTERTARRVTRVHPQNGQRSTLIEIPEVYVAGGQDGLLGMALHPALLTGVGRDYVYVAFTYDIDPTDGVARRVKLRRYTYDSATQTLRDPIDLVDGLPGSSDHNSGRLVFGPDDKLYYTIGDQGKNQFSYKCLENQAQRLPTQSEIDAHDWSAYQGKVLRIGLDGSIPSDNPLIGGVRSHVYSYGHRNPQGIAFGRNGRLYADEHGPKTDDELNWIRPGLNYGWPYVAGHRDGRAYVYANWSAAPDCWNLAFSDYVLPPSVPTQAESAFTAPFAEPLMTFYTVDNGHNFSDPKCSDGSRYMCWPTIAPSALEFYAADSGGVPGWGDSLLVVSLKHGSVFRVELNAAGDEVVGEATPLFKTTNRYRDVVVAPGGDRFYVITDSGGATVGPSGGDTGVELRGAVLEFSYRSDD